MSRVLVVACTRPNFVKAAPIVAVLDLHGADHILVHSNQHCDAAMSDSLATALDISTPEQHLGVGSGTHAERTARAMLAFDPVDGAARFPEDAGSAVLCRRHHHRFGRGSGGDDGAENPVRHIAIEHRATDYRD